MQNFGLVRRGTGNAILEPLAIPKLDDDYILVRTVAVALNPTDWTTLDAVGDDGTLVGCDYAGVVEAVGKNVTKKFNKGDRVAGFGHGGNDLNPEMGAFSRFITVKGDLQLRIPEEVSFDAASTVAVGVATVGFALYKVLGLPWPDKSADQAAASETLFVFGGSTATGTLAIQFAKLSGWKVVTTCSPRNFDLVRERGADAVFDYRDPNVAAKLKQAAESEITKILDTVNTDDSAALCAQVFGSDGGTYCNLLGVECPRADVESVFFLGYDMSGEAYKFEGQHFEAKPESFDFGLRWINTAEKLWFEGAWQPHPQQVGADGLAGVLDGLNEMRQGRVSGQKLVYRVDDTPWLWNGSI